MANYKLGKNLPEQMVARATSLIRRREDQARTGFPLSEDILRDAILPARWRHNIKEMVTEGMTGIPKTRQIQVMVAGLPGLERDVILHLGVHGEGILHAHNQVQACYYYDIVCHFKLEVRSETDDEMLARITPDWSLFPVEQLTSLAAWTNNLVTETRLVRIARRVIKDYLVNQPELSRTVGHVMARWPGLALLVAEDKIWRRRFANPPRNLKPYGWSENSAWLKLYGKAMKLADMVLLSADMLPAEIKLNSHEQPFVPQLKTWRSLPTDKDVAP